MTYFAANMSELNLSDNHIQDSGSNGLTAQPPSDKAPEVGGRLATPTISNPENLSDCIVNSADQYTVYEAKLSRLKSKDHWIAVEDVREAVQKLKDKKVAIVLCKTCNCYVSCDKKANFYCNLCGEKFIGGKTAWIIFEDDVDSIFGPQLVRNKNG